MPLRRQTIIRNHRAHKTGSVFSLGPVAARFLILVMLAVFSLLYLIQATQAATSTEQLQTISAGQSQADQQITTLQVNASHFQALPTIGQSASSQGLVPIEANPATVTVPSSK